MLSDKELEMLYATEKIVNLNSQIKNELGIEDDEQFVISEIIGAYEMVKIVNQYGQQYTINSKYISK